MLVMNLFFHGLRQSQSTLVPEVFLDFSPHERAWESHEAANRSRDATRKKNL